jgi:hypothetical protein
MPASDQQHLIRAKQSQRKTGANASLNEYASDSFSRRHKYQISSAYRPVNEVILARIGVSHRVQRRKPRIPDRWFLHQPDK